MSAAIRLGIVGAEGRMGLRIDALATESPRFEVRARVDREEAGLSNVNPDDIDCVIDFSVREQVPKTASWCASHGIPFVLGTTGLLQSDKDALKYAASSVALLSAANFSVGVNALFALAKEAAMLAGRDYDLEIIEAHHRHKVDAPSGTARELLRILAECRGADADISARHGRHGIVGARTDDEIGVSVVRGGDVVGEHTVLLLAEGETLALTHRATDRDIFARGALRAAAWLVDKGKRSPGHYGMDDMLRAQ